MQNYNSVYIYHIKLWGVILSYFWRIKVRFGTAKVLTSKVCKNDWILFGAGIWSRFCFRTVCKSPIRNVQNAICHKEQRIYIKCVYFSSLDNILNQRLLGKWNLKLDV